jgi:hypothetical protein
MDPSIVVAIVTAIASISAALIQAASTIRVAKIKELSPQAQPARVTPPSEVVNETHSQAWWWVIGLLVATNFLWINFLENEAPNIIHLGAIPWCTCLLAYFRPLRWGYVAGIVTSISLIAVFGFLFLGGTYLDSEISQLALLFVANSTLAAGIAYFRQPKMNRGEISNAANSHQVAKPE